MKKFSFRLEKYLNLKSQLENLQRINLASAQAIYRKEEEMLLKIEEHLRQIYERTKKTRYGAVNQELLFYYDQYFSIQTERKAQQDLIVLQAREKLEQEKRKFIELQKDRRLLERLRDRLWEAYFRELLIEEQKNLDEMGLNLYLRK